MERCSICPPHFVETYAIVERGALTFEEVQGIRHGRLKLQSRVSEKGVRSDYIVNSQRSFFFAIEAIPFAKILHYTYSDF